MPLVGDVDGTSYFKPEGKQLLCSCEDETLHELGNARADVYEIARVIEEINIATILNARHVRAPWAGLRNFVEDGIPLVGWDQEVEGVFWFAGHEGYGIQIPPALGQLGAALVRAEDTPTSLADIRCSASSLLSSRLSQSVSPG